MGDFGFTLAMSIVFATGVTSGAAVTGIVAGVQAALLLAPVGLSLGVSAYAANQARKQIAPVSDINGLQSILKQAIPPQRLCLGTVTTGGALFFYKAKKPYIWMGILLAAHEVDGLDSVYIDGSQVFFDPSTGLATSTPFSDGAQQYLKASFRTGAMDQAIDTIIASDFPTMPTTFRQRGHATMVIRAHYGFGANFEAKYDDHKRIYGDQGVLQPLTRFRGAKCYDPRQPGHVLGTPATWTWSDNAAICLARFLTNQWPDTRLTDPTRLDWDMVARAADECDRWEVGNDGTTFRRHTINGVVQSTDSPYDVIENMKIAMGGHLVLDRAKIYPVVRGRRTPAGTLHMNMLLGGVEYASEPRDRELINIIKSSFVAPDREYQEVSGPVLRRADLIALDGKPREASVRGAFVEGHRRIQRIASAMLNQARIGRTLTAGATLEAMNWAPGEVYRVHLTGDALSRCNGLYELARKDWDDRMRGYRLTLIGYSDTVTDFDPLVDEQDFVLDDATLEAEAA